MKKLISFLLLIAIGFPLSAVEKYNFTSLDVKDGVPDNFIHKMLRDEYGFMWIISGQVLCRYDGYDFKVYQLPLPGRYSHYFLKEDSNGNIWLRTNDNYYRYDRNLDILSDDFSKVIDYPVPSGGFRYMDVDYDGNVWFSTKSGELICYRGPDDYDLVSIPEEYRPHCLESRDGESFILFDDGSVYELKGHHDKSAQYVTKVPSPGKYDQGMYLDVDRTLWFYVPHSSEDHLMSYDLETDKFNYIYDNAQEAINFVTDVMDDRKGHLWISTDNAGIIIYDKATGRSSKLLSVENDRYSLPSNHINSLYLDSHDIMWVGTSKRGVAYTGLNSTIFEKIDYPGLDDISCVQEDREGNIWLGTDGGGILCEEKKSGRQKHYSSASGDIPGELIVCSHLDSKGRVWFGTFGDGVFYYDEGVFVCVRNQDTGKDEYMKDIRAIEEDASGNIWIGTIAYGLFCRETDGSFTDYTVDNTILASNGITDLYCDGGNTLYIATTSGLYIMDVPSRDIEKIGGFPEAIMTCVHKDYRGLIWVGCSDGIYVYNATNGQIAHLDHSNGLSHDYVRGLCEDDNNNMWITSDVGVTNVVVVDDPTLSMPIFRCWRYYDCDGLDNIMFNPHSISCLSDGDIVMGGIGGLVKTSPSQKPTVSSQSSVQFSALYMANQRVEVGEEIRGKVILESNIQTTEGIVLNCSDNTFSIGVSSLNYLMLHKSKLMYRLKGHTDWIMLDGNVIHFNKLHPGTYELQVKVSEIESADGNEASLKIRIKPPVLQSAAAYAVYALLMVLIICFLVIRIRQKTKMKYKMHILEMNISHQHEIDESHMRFFTNISHDLRTPLSLVITPLERMLGKESIDAKTRRELKEIHRNAEDLMDTVNQLLDFKKLDSGMGALNLSHGNLTDLVKEVCKSFKPYSVKKKVSLNLHLTEKEVRINFDKDKMRRILVNILSNAFKFNSENGSITVSLDIINQDGQDKVRIMVADTGIGIPDENKPRIFDRFYQATNLTDNIGSGIGLNIVKEFVNLHGGTVTVADNHPKGTVFTLIFPCERGSEEASANKRKESGHQKDQASGENECPILVVEDNDNFRDFLVDCIKERYPVIAASNGKDAMAIIEKKQIRMVISDVMMPKMNGLELCKNLKNDIRFSHIPVILLTAKTTDDNILQGLKEGSDDYITKPFNLDILLMRIEKLLEWSQSNHIKFKTIDVSPSEIAITSLDEKLIEKAIHLVEENMDNMDFTVDELSSSIGMTRGHLYKKLMAITGKTPLDFIRTIRIKRGRQLLEKSQLGVADVAYRVGLSPKQFAKYFKESFGELPSDYRRRMLSSNQK